MTNKNMRTFLRDSITKEIETQKIAKKEKKIITSFKLFHRRKYKWDFHSH